MEVARTSMIHAASPHFLWPFAVRYAAHQLNLWPRVSEPKTSPTLRWTGKVGDASAFRHLPPLLLLWLLLYSLMLWLNNTCCCGRDSCSTLSWCGRNFTCCCGRDSCSTLSCCGCNCTYTVVNPPLLSLAVAGTPHLLSPDALTEIAAAAGAAAAGAAVAAAATAVAAVTPLLLSLDAPTETTAAADAAAAVAVTSPLFSPNARTEIAAAAVLSQTTPAPPSPTCLNAALRSGNAQCAA
ncbi:unnamed protein product [Closterium sp. NIES-54]